jgi:spore germination protein
MCYNYSSKTSKPGPICPLFWLAKIMKFAESQVPPEKLCVALGLYGYDWSKKDCNSVNLKKVIELAEENSAQLIWDRKSQSPYFTYFKAGARHMVWFESQESITKKIQLIKKYNINHIAIWHLGMMDVSLAESLASFLEQ